MWYLNWFFFQSTKHNMPAGRYKIYFYYKKKNEWIEWKKIWLQQIRNIWLFIINNNNKNDDDHWPVDRLINWIDRSFLLLLVVVEITTNQPTNQPNSIMDDEDDDKTTTTSNIIIILKIWLSSSQQKSSTVQQNISLYLLCIMRCIWIIYLFFLSLPGNFFFLNIQIYSSNEQMIFEYIKINNNNNKHQPWYSNFVIKPINLDPGERNR